MQPTTWSSFYFDLQFLVFFFPLGLYYCFKDLNNANIFIVLYGTLRFGFVSAGGNGLMSRSIYFAGVMVRLILVLAPVACILGGIGMSGLLTAYIPDLTAGMALVMKILSALNCGIQGSATSASATSSKKDKKEDKSQAYKHEVHMIVHKCAQPSRSSRLP